MKIRVAILLKAAFGKCRTITDSLRTRYKSTWREVSTSFWKKLALYRFYRQSLWLRFTRFPNRCKERTRNVCIVVWLTIRAWSRKKDTWQNLQDHNAQLRDAVTRQADEIVRLKQQRNSDESLIMNLFQFHDDRADQNHNHPTMLKLVIPAVRLALLRLKNDVQGVYRG